jgi:hypothetical protein
MVCRGGFGGDAARPVLYVSRTPPVRSCKPHPTTCRAPQVIPHAEFSFAKLWVMAAHLEVRAKDVAAARKVYGRGIGVAPKEKLFKGYIELELQVPHRGRALLPSLAPSCPLLPAHSPPAGSKRAKEGMSQREKEENREAGKEGKRERGKEGY